MTHASLFSGIGGFDLAAHWAGWKNLFNCEINPFCQTVLKHHFPNATQYSDITTTDFTPWHGKIDVLTGGFPCQPFSQSGKRKGTADNRYLWPQMLGAIQQIQPRWIVGENVRGIVSWSKGLVFEQVCSDLEAAGYEVTPFLLPACSVDAPHERYRVWFIAHRTDTRTKSLQQRQDRVSEFGIAPDTSCQGWRVRRPDCRLETYMSTERTGVSEWISGPCQIKPTTDTSCHRLQARNESRTSRKCTAFNGFDRFPTQPPVCRGDDGLSDRLDYDTVFAGVPKSKRAKAFPRWRSESIKGFGNAIVPQIAFQIFNAINQYNNLIQP